ncbi:alpha/beta fold hydrolase [Desertihabitans brevis]|uniref:Alpha/beta fold hydrolase n=1 Tax=Desertihabitans brevis TaxID=2268447 RepID=A0A367YZS9_9ACTN|nr:alpha/beta fold hydrolase [Desertihabitans brevis]RCK71328.1 alpha/beta fold hydrolase [Desertihabitans brevis]
MLLHVDELRLESGELLQGAVIGYRTYGRLAETGDNAVLLFSYYTGNHDSYDPWIGPGRPLDPDRHLVVVVDHLGGGVSTSPSHGLDVVPELTTGDCVEAARLVLASLGVRRLRLAAGWSLGGMQALELAVRHPSSVEAVLALCSAARCSEVNEVFLGSVAAALGADPEPGARVGRNAFGRVYAGWAYSEEFFAEGLYREFGYRDPADVLSSWGRDHEDHHADDLLASLRMWLRADVGRGRGGTLAALATITARTLLMPASTDQYFTVGENEREVGALRRGELRVLESPLGHVAGRPGVRAAEQQVVDRALRDLLDDPAS